MSELVWSWPGLVVQRIASWGGWPKDVEPVLREWNRKGLLTFLRVRQSSVNGIPYFICDDCGRAIRCHANGDAYWSPRGVRWHVELPDPGDRLDDGVALCEDCLIDRARSSVSA